MELKVICQCGQKYKFDVEPVGGRMPFTVNCPVCNLDGTANANARIGEQLRAAAPPPRPMAPPAFAGAAPVPIAAPPAPISPPPPVGSLHINRPVQAAPALPVSAGAPPQPIGALKPIAAVKKSNAVNAGEFSLMRGIMGAISGAAVGCGLMFGFWMWAGFRFPLSGVAVGVTAGYGARWLARGTDTTLGAITASIAAASVAGTFVVMYGGFPILNIVSVVICASVAYRAASE